MKKINSIWFGGTIVGIGLIFTAVIPLLLYFSELLFDISGILPVLLRLSFIIGVLILLFFTILLIIELKQDKKIDRSYFKTRNKKIELPDSTFECQNCGSRKVEKSDTSCNLCGIRFD